MAENYPMQDPYSLLSELNTRVRILEGKYNLTRERMLIVNQNMLDHYKKLNSDMRSMQEDITEIKDSINLLKETLKDMIGELRLLARKDDVKVLEKYINLWNPVNSITKDEVNELIENKLKNARSKR